VSLLMSESASANVRMPKVKEARTKSDDADEESTSFLLPPPSHAYILVCILYDLGASTSVLLDVSTNVNKNQLWRCGIFVGRGAKGRQTATAMAKEYQT
jgi:hypothetical protein